MQDCATGTRCPSIIGIGEEDSVEWQGRVGLSPALATVLCPQNSRRQHQTAAALASTSHYSSGVCIREEDRIEASERAARLPCPCGASIGGAQDRALISHHNSSIGIGEEYPV